MAVKKRSGAWYAYFRPFKDRQIGVKLDVETKTEAKQVEAMLVRACRTGDYGTLDAVGRDAAIRMFENQSWQLPEGLAASSSDVTSQERLTLWKACELFFKYPETQGKSQRCMERYQMCVVHLVKHFGKDRLVESMWVPDVKRYQIERLDSGASPSTVNWEKGTLSRIFQVLVELRLVETNPCRLVKNLSQKSEERQVYLSLKTVQAIAAKCPEWYQPIVWTAFYTGMRRGEILGLTRRQVNLAKRMIYLGPEDTKEGHWKRVPIHKKLLPILRTALQGPALLSGKVFGLRDKKGVRELELESFKNPWERACDALELKDPLPRFHDLRHTWRTNARRSGIDAQIAESIMGHWFKGKSVNDRYGYISDKELLRAADKMTFNHGETKILAVKKEKDDPAEKCEHFVNKLTPPKKKAMCAHRLSS